MDIANVPRNPFFNVQNNSSQTELFNAANSLRHNENDNAVLKLILELGSDPSIKDDGDYTALDFFKAVNKNTGHIVENYDSICNILTPHNEAISELDVIKAPDTLDTLLSNTDMPSPVENNIQPSVEQPIVLEANVTQPSFYTQIYNWFHTETTPA